MRFSLLVLILSCAAFAGTAPDPKTPPAPVAKPSGMDLQRESIKRQRDSLRQQLGIRVEASNADFEFLTPPTLKPEVDCPALPSEQIESLIEAASKRHSLETKLIRAVMRQESGFKPCAVSTKGALGLMQLMPATVSELGNFDAFNPEANVNAGAAYLKQQLTKYYDNLRLALVAYNAGGTRADQLDPSQYPAETQDYVANILAEVGDKQAAKPKDDGNGDPLPVP